MIGVIGIDADRRRLAVVSHVGARKAWFTLERSDGAVVRWGYTLGLSNLMEQAKGRAVVFLEDCYLPRRGNPLRDVDTFRVLANVQGEILYEASRHGVEVRRVSGGWEVSYEPVLRCGQPNIVAAKQLAHAIARKMEGEA